MNNYKYHLLNAYDQFENAIAISLLLIQLHSSAVEELDRR